jgi:hypothetical protein
MSRCLFLSTPRQDEHAAQPMTLTTHDIRNEAGDAVWNQGEVR